LNASNSCAPSRTRGDSSLNQCSANRTWGISLAADALLDLRRAFVAGRPEPGREGRRVVEVGPLEPEADGGEERVDALHLRHALPEPVADLERAERVASLREHLGVQVHVAHLVLQNADEAAAQQLGRRREGHDRPGHQLGRLQLVVKERVEQPRASALGAKGALAGALQAVLRDAERGPAARPQLAHRGPRWREHRRRAGRRELRLERVREHIGDRPGLERPCWGGWSEMMRHGDRGIRL
jgi:hypothetical protein